MAPQPPRVAGIDIDGVLADPRHRLHFLSGRPKNWRGFFGGAHLDPPLPAGIALVKELVADGVAIVYVTGRPDYLRSRTQEWLASQGLPHDVLHMRSRGDFRPAPQVKLEIYRSIAQEFRLEVIVDDDVRVVTALTQAGLPVQLADWFDPAATPLTQAQDEDGRT